MKTEIKEAQAVYTGGNIWLFYGELKDGNYFLTDDYGATLILDEDPSDLDQSLYEEWQQDHTVTELVGSERAEFCDSLVTWLQCAEWMSRGGMTDIELKSYRDYFKEDL